MSCKVLSAQRSITSQVFLENLGLGLGGTSLLWSALVAIECRDEQQPNRLAR